jgi:hypothetical protein
MADASTDKSTVNLVVLLLGVAAILGLGGLVYLIQDGTEAEQLIVVSTPVAGIVGALGAMLSSTRSVDLDGLRKLSDSAAANKVTNMLAEPPPLEASSRDFNVQGDYVPTAADRLAAGDDPEFA